MRRACLVLLFATTPLATACAPYGARPVGTRPGMQYSYSTALGSRVWVPEWKYDRHAGIYDAREHCRQCDDDDEPVYATPIGGIAPPLPASEKDRVPEPPERRPFDPMAALAAVRAVDLAPCRDETAPRGRGHAFVTFTADGYTVKVLIDDPAGLSPRAVECIGLTLGRARITPYAGPDTPVGVSFFVP